MIGVGRCRAVGGDIGHHGPDALVQPVVARHPGVGHAGKDRRAAAVVVRMGQSQSVAEFVDQRPVAVAADVQAAIGIVVVPAEGFEVEIAVGIGVATEQDRVVVLVGRLKCVLRRAVLAIVAVKHGAGDAVLDQVRIDGVADLDERDVGDVRPALQGGCDRIPLDRGPRGYVVAEKIPDGDRIAEHIVVGPDVAAPLDRADIRVIEWEDIHDVRHVCLPIKRAMRALPGCFT